MHKTNQSHFVQVVVEVSTASTQVPAEQGSMGGEYEADIQLS